MARLRQEWPGVQQQNAEDTIVVKGKSLEFTAGTTSGAQAQFSVNGIGDFVAVLRYQAVSQKPAIIFRFHRNQQAGYAVRIPAYVKLSPPDSGALPIGDHLCCQDFDIFVTPLKAGGHALFTGPPPRSLPVAPNDEEQLTAISVKGPLIVVYANGREIARLSDSSFGPGGINMGVNFKARQSASATRNTTASPSRAALSVTCPCTGWGPVY
jgi:hypothetical protein